MCLVIIVWRLECFQLWGDVFGLIPVAQLVEPDLAASGELLLEQLLECLFYFGGRDGEAFLGEAVFDESIGVFGLLQDDHRAVAFVGPQVQGVSARQLVQLVLDRLDGGAFIQHEQHQARGSQAGLGHKQLERLWESVAALVLPTWSHETLNIRTFKVLIGL